MGFEMDPDHVPKAKLVLHGAQVLLVFVLWCLELAVFNGKDSEIESRNGWTFGVVSTHLDTLPC